MSANLTSDKIMKELAAGEYDLEWLDANHKTVVREMAREILDRRSDPRTRIHVFGDDVPEGVRPWRAAWLAYVEQAGRCWCGVGKEGTASWACEHVKCASDVGALVESRVEATRAKTNEIRDGIGRIIIALEEVDQTVRTAGVSATPKEPAKHLWKAPGESVCGDYGPNESLLSDPRQVTCLMCIETARGELAHARAAANAPVPIRLHCPVCGELHVDEGEFADKPHHTHACQNDECGMVWRPAIVPTVGVRFLPGFKNEGRRT